MRTFWTLLLASLRRGKRTFAALFLLVLSGVVCASLAITVHFNSVAAVNEGLERLGYGSLTAWISGCDDLAALQEQLENQDGITEVTVQPLIFSGYSINGGHSDDDGELLAWDAGQVDYRFYNDALDGYAHPDAIATGTVWISPAMQSAYGAQIGDTIQFELSRENTGVEFTVAGFFEDPFMGSSMVDRKSFLFSQSDHEALIQTLQSTSDFNRLARTGAILHIFSDSAQSITELNQLLNENTELGRYSESVYALSTIRGFMLLLQNIFCGFLAAFAGILLAVVLLVLANTIRQMTQANRAELGLLKTIGCKSSLLHAVQIIQYLFPVLAGILTGFAITAPLSFAVRNLTITSSGILIPASLPMGRLLLCYAAQILLIAGFVCTATSPVLRIRPMQAIRSGKGMSVRLRRQNALHPKGLGISLAIRQLLAGKQRYVGVLLVTALLTLLLGVVGKLNTWVGPNGEGLMNTFSVAEHDLGIQPTVSDFDMAEVEALIGEKTAVTAVYRIAMQSGTVNGVDLTVNVLDEPEWFHILRGKAAERSDELLLTEYVANDLALNVGDEVSVSSGGNTASYTVVGIYECANGMGANVGMSLEGYRRIGDVNAQIWCTHFILQDSSFRAELMDDLTARYRLVADIHDNSWSGLDGIVSALHVVLVLMYGITAGIICVVVALSTGRVLSAEKPELAIYKSLGFTVSALRVNFVLRYGLTALGGAFAGNLCNLFLGNRIVSGILQGFGVGGFSAQAGLSSFLFPLVVITGLTFVFTWLFTRQIKTVSVTLLLQKED